MRAATCAGRPAGPGAAARANLAAIAFCLAAILPAVPPRAAELHIGFSDDISTLDPADHRDRGTETVLRNAFDGLLTRDSGMQVVPEIAESWRALSPVLYEFRLRDGVRFHDGRRVTADDVKYSFDRIIQPDAFGGRGSPRKGLLGPLESVSAIDSRTVRFRLAEPWPIFAAMLPFQQIVARPRAVQPAEDAGGAGREAPAARSGAGPFRLVEWVPGEAIVLERFADYYGGAPDLPPVGAACLDRVVFHVVPNNESRVAGLLAGDFHLVTDILPHSIPVIERHAGSRVMTVEGTRSYFLALNTEAAPFVDARARQAVAHALDRERLVRELLLGQATPIDGILSPKALGKSTTLKRYPHDPERARQLLAAAGHPGGIQVELDVEARLAPIAEAIGAQLLAAGIRSRTVVGDGRTLAAKWEEPGTGDRKGHLWLTSWGNASLDPAGILEPTHRTGGPGNAAGYASPEMDRLLDAAAVEIDPQRRADLFRRAEELASGDLPYVPLWVPREAYGVSTRVGGWQPRPDGRINLHDVCLEDPR